MRIFLFYFLNRALFTFNGAVPQNPISSFLEKDIKKGIDIIDASNRQTAYANNFYCNIECILIAITIFSRKMDRFPENWKQTI